ncbi:hypothetical protein ACTVPA_09230 [Serratia bockelmannii]|uniref:hypothetical protein n=1 Tax=Serratia TaxID=613 RepID=UPI003E32EA9E
MAWTMFYQDDWDLYDVLGYAAFVYLIQFPECGEYYIGVKGVYQKVKDASKIKSTSIESNWEKYNSSSKEVQERIATGEHHTKQILWCFKTRQEAELVEAALIAYCGTDHLCRNKALMTKTRLKKDNGEQRRIIRMLMEAFT